MNQLKRLEDDYTDTFHVSCKLFGTDVVLSKLHRLNEIYNVTEERWEANLQRLVNSNVTIKYLLIGEAAPWSSEGQYVKYFYNGDFKGLGDAILPGFTINTVDLESIYQGLAKKQFILVDVLPFAFQYTSKIRGKHGYNEMIKSCSQYLKTKLYDSRLRWESDVKVSFGYKKNAKSFMEVYNYKLALPNGQIIFLEDKMIIADGSGFPHADGVRRVFGF